MNKSILKHVYDFLGLPLRLILFPDSCCQRIGLTSLEEERVFTVLPNVKGKLLDIGCGNNRLVREYGRGVGIDVYRRSDDVIIVEDSSSIPMESHIFDTITFLASLNHVPNREEAIKEARRLLKDDGRIIVTMINPVLGMIGHKIWWYGEDRERGMEPGETYGLWNKDIIEMFKRNGFELELHKRFVYCMNNLFVFRKKSGHGSGAS